MKTLLSILILSSLALAQAPAPSCVSFSTATGSTTLCGTSNDVTISINGATAKSVQGTPGPAGPQGPAGPAGTSATLPSTLSCTMKITGTNPDNTLTVTLSNCK